jgi:hypothetical protein
MGGLVDPRTRSGPPPPSGRRTAIPRSSSMQLSRYTDWAIPVSGLDVATKRKAQLFEPRPSSTQPADWTTPVYIHVTLENPAASTMKNTVFCDVMRYKVIIVSEDQFLPSTSGQPWGCMQQVPLEILLTFYHNIRHDIPKDSNIHTERLEDLKSDIQAGKYIVQKSFKEVFKTGREIKLLSTSLLLLNSLFSFILVDAIIWGTMLQAGRSQVRFTMSSLDFSIDLILPSALWPWGRLGL